VISSILSENNRDSIKVQSPATSFIQNLKKPEVIFKPVNTINIGKYTSSKIKEDQNINIHTDLKIQSLENKKMLKSKSK